MGKIMTTMKLTNDTDLQNARAGILPPERVRMVQIEGLVDPGATTLVLPADVVAQLGLAVRGIKKVRYADGRVAQIPWVAGLIVEILGRETSCEAFVEHAGTTPLIGQIPLEALDLLVDPKTRELRVNPASPDAPLLDLLAAS
jgi:clan AA aspartic protease